MTIRTVLYALPILAIAWLGLLAGVMVVTEQAPVALVIGPVVIPADAAIVADPWIGVSLQSDAPGFVADLYRSGAWLVLPAGLLGCAG